MNEFIRKYFNEVCTLTAVCRSNSSWLKGEYPELEIGKTYNVTHISVQKSASYIILSEFGTDRYYLAGCFEIYENGMPMDKLYVHDLRFLAPYYRRLWGQRNPPVAIAMRGDVTGDARHRCFHIKPAVDNSVLRLCRPQHLWLLDCGTPLLSRNHQGNL